MTDVGGTEPFTDRLRTLRLACGMTQEDLATRTGFHVTRIAHLEAGRVQRHRNPTLLTLRTLAEALNCTVAQLIGEADD
jgi:transcriptional regulator with XRE-family HTH domain